MDPFHVHPQTQDASTPLRIKILFRPTLSPQFFPNHKTSGAPHLAGFSRDVGYHSPPRCNPVGPETILREPSAGIRSSTNQRRIQSRMINRTLSLSGLAVHRLGYGTMRLVGEGAWGEPKSRDHAHAILRTAVTSGINFIDTADAYGPEIAEELIYRSPPPISSQSGDRYQRRHHSPGTSKSSTGGPPGVPPSVCRDEPAPPASRHHSALPTPSHRSPGTNGGISRQARLVTRTG